jgi:Uri superfamily endonuclease
MMEKIQDETDRRHLESDTKLDTPVLQVDTYIVARYEDGPKSKQQSRWHGPYRIVRVNKRPQGTVYTVYNAKKESEKDYHEAYIKPYPTIEGFGDADALRLSVLDDDMYIVDKIIEHRYNSNKQLELHVWMVWHH